MKRFITVFLFLLALAANAYPLEDSTPRSDVNLEDMTMEEAIALALDRSIEIKKTAINIRNNETKLSEETVWSWLRPNLSLKGGVDVETGEPGLSMGVGIDLKDVMGAGNRRIRSLNFSIREEKENIEAIKGSIRIKVNGAYKEYRMAREKVNATEETLQKDEVLLKALEVRGSEMERLLVRSMINQDRIALMTARQELERAETNLRELLGLAPL